MTDAQEQEQPTVQKFLWPGVVAFLGTLATIVVILVFVPASNATAQQAVVAILAMLGSAVSSLFVLFKVSGLHGDVQEVKANVNGRMTELIAAKTIPADPPAEASPSAETR